MSDPVTLPLGLAVVLASLAAWAVLERLLVPGVRWFLRRRVERVVEEVNRRLAIEIRPFQRTRRRVLIDRLAWDPKVLAAVDDAVAEGVPRDVAMARVGRYAREIVPSFNAYAYFRRRHPPRPRLVRALYRVRLAALDEAALAAGAAGGDGDLRDEPPQQHGLRPRRLPRRHRDRALLRGRRVGAGVAPADAGPLARRLLRPPALRRPSLPHGARALRGRWPVESGVTAGDLPGRGVVARRSAPPAEDRPRRLHPARLRRPGASATSCSCRSASTTTACSRTARWCAISTRRRRPRAPCSHAATARSASSPARPPSSSARRWHRFGYACVGFGRPLSLTAWLAARGAEPAAMEREPRIALATELAGELMARVGEVVPVVPVAQVARVFLDRLDGMEGGAGGDGVRRGDGLHGDGLLGDGVLGDGVLGEGAAAGLTRSELQREVDTLAGRLRAGGAAVYLPRHDQDYAVEVGLRMLTLRNLVLADGGVFRPNPAERTLLAYYANSIDHLPGAESSRRRGETAMAS
jgi:glycerol-3-phosphate O-acyltransferase